jgi:hypothetical protein
MLSSRPARVGNAQASSACKTHVTIEACCGASKRLSQKTRARRCTFDVCTELNYSSAVPADHTLVAFSPACWRRVDTATGTSLGSLLVQCCRRTRKMKRVCSVQCGVRCTAHVVVHRSWRALLQASVHSRRLSKIATADRGKACCMGRTHPSNAYNTQPSSMNNRYSEITPQQVKKENQT